jgi:hypothetical protein
MPYSYFQVNRPRARGARPCARQVWFKYMKTVVRSLLRRHQVNWSTKETSWHLCFLQEGEKGKG